MDYKTPLAKVRGLGAAHNGTAHWWMLRVSSFVLILMTGWFILYCNQLLHASHAQITTWLAEPLNSFFAIVWIITVVYHTALGLQVVIEDYVHTTWRKIAAVWGVKIGFLGLGLACVIAILSIRDVTF